MGVVCFKVNLASYCVYRREFMLKWHNRQSWNDFFLSKERVSDDFMSERVIASRSERLSFDNDE